MRCGDSHHVRYLPLHQLCKSAIHDASPSFLRFYDSGQHGLKSERISTASFLKRRTRLFGRLWLQHTNTTILNPISTLVISRYCTQIYISVYIPEDTSRPLYGMGQCLWLQVKPMLLSMKIASTIPDAASMPLREQSREKVVPCRPCWHKLDTDGESYQCISTANENDTGQEKKY